MDIFDILGPVMVGPSSSHTAGAARIGAMARTLLGEEIADAKLHLYGSFAETGRGHGTDRALVAGLLGMEPDEENHALTRIEANVPMAEMGDYNTMLRASTQGRGSYQIRFDSYEEAPANVAQKVMETYKAETEE